MKQWTESRMKKLGYYDMALIKLSVAGFALMIAKLWPTIISLAWYWYAAIFVLAAIKPAYRILKD